jgi:hypothetical protein
MNNSMNKIYKFFALLSVVATMFTSCSPDEYALGAKDVQPGDLVEGIAYKIEHDAANPNIVYLKSLMGNKYTPLWNHPQGRSQDQSVTLKMPFAGTYNVQFGVETQGGVVYGDTATFKIDKMYADFISDPLWTNLTGGVGKEKVWIIDNGKYGMAPGALSYADPASVLEFNNFSPNWEPGGNANGSTDKDMGWGSTMTFSLKGGAFLTTHKLNEGGKDENGLFTMNVSNHTLSTTNATVLRPDNFIANAANWTTDLKILTLTENQLRIAVLRSNSEGPWWYILNYVSKSYADTYVAVEPEPALPSDWQSGISQTTSKTVKWVLSPTTPFNWAKLDGSLMNTDWTSPATYAGWTGFTAASASAYEKFSLTLNSENNTAVYVGIDGSSTSGTYTLDNKGIYTFSGFTPNFIICGGWVSLATTAANQWRITNIKKDLAGNVTDMWVGKRDEVKPEYMVYHLVPQIGSGSTEPKGTTIAVDNSKIAVGDLEGKGSNLRLEIYNEYGSTKANPAINPSDIKFANKMSITFTLKGITLKSGAAGSYKASISFANPDWSVSYWGGGAGDATVTGDGTYTVTFEPTATVANGALVFTVDIKDIIPDIEDLGAVKATIDKLTLF